jgi:hypothetical protein
MSRQRHEKWGMVEGQWAQHGCQQDHGNNDVKWWGRWWDDGTITRWQGQWGQCLKRTMLEDESKMGMMMGQRQDDKDNGDNAQGW